MWSWSIEHGVTFDGAPNSANWNLDISTLGLTPGFTYSIHAHPVDNAGNNLVPTWPWYTRKFNIINTNQPVDTTLSTATIESPAENNQSLSIDSLLFGTATDEGGSGLDYIRLLIRNIDTGEFIAPDASRVNTWSWSVEHRVTFDGAPNSANWNLDISELGLTPGSTYSIHAHPVDNAGNNLVPTWPWHFKHFTVE